MTYRATISELRVAAGLLLLTACGNSVDAPKASCPPDCATSPANGAAGNAAAPSSPSNPGARPTAASTIGAAAAGASVGAAGNSGSSATAAGTGAAGTVAGNAGMTAPPAVDAGTAGGGGTPGSAAGSGTAGGPSTAMQTLPAIDDYGARGPFETMAVENTGPDGMYTMYRPRTLGEGGFLHPPTTWGNGITTTPSLYDALLSTIASHGFVIIASNSTSVTAEMMTAGLDWLLQQNDMPGDFQGKLDVMRAVSIGYSLGGGAAVTTGKHPNVVVTASLHGLTGTSAALHGPLLLFTSTGDTFVSAAQFVDPTFNMSAVQTFYGTLTGGSHLNPIGDAGDERAPLVAWLRLWVYGDEGAKKYFYGDDCILCKTPWTNPQRKHWP